MKVKVVIKMSNEEKVFSKPSINWLVLIYSTLKRNFYKIKKKQVCACYII